MRQEVPLCGIQRWPLLPSLFVWPFALLRITDRDTPSLLVFAKLTSRPMPQWEGPVDPTILRQEAEELARLSAGVPSQMGQVTDGKMPKDLADQLKRIEKLAKHLRTEISQ